MDLLRVRQVVAGGYRRLVQQDQGRVSDLPLRRLKCGGGAEPELVIQDSGDRVTLRVLWRFAAAGSARPSGGTTRPR